MSDTTFCISIVVNKELDPDVYEILTIIQSSKLRSEFARISMRIRSVKEIKSRRIVTAKSSERPRKDNSDPDSLHDDGISKQLKSGAGQGGKPGKGSAAPTSASTAFQPDHWVADVGVEKGEDDFVDGLVTGIQGVPKR